MRTCVRYFQLSVVTAAIATASLTSSAADAPPPRTIRDITALLDQYQPDPAKAAEVRRILDAPPPETQDRKDLARFYKQKADLAEEVGAARDNVIARRKVVEYGGDWDPEEDLQFLVQAERMAGNLHEAIAALEKLLGSISSSGYTRGKRISPLGNLARTYAQLGDFEKSAAYDRQMESESKTLNFSSPGLRWAVNANHGIFLEFQGKLTEAEVLLRSAAELVPDMIAEVQRARISRRGGARWTDGMLLYIASGTQAVLARIIAAQGRTTEAELIARTALQEAIQKMGRYSFYTAAIATPYVDILQQQGRYPEAEELARAGIDILRNVGTPEDALHMYNLRSALGVSLVAQQRYAEALDEFSGMRTAFASLPDLQAKLVRGNASWALALIETGDTVGALAMLDTLIANSREWLGAGHPDTVTLIALRAMALARAGQLEAALGGFYGVQPALIAAAQAQDEEPAPFKTQTLSLLLETYLRVLGEVHDTPLAKAAGIDAAAEAFRIADVLRGQSTQQAVVASAVRAAANDPAIGKEIRKQQDLDQEAAALFRLVRDLMNAPPDQQLPKVIADMKARIEAIKEARVALQADIEKQFPAYANLIRPQPPKLAEARAILAPGEALVNIFSGTHATYVWAMQRDGQMAFRVVPLTRSQIAEKVRKLRAALDPGDVDITRKLPRFDLDVGYELYSQLLAPVATGWQGASSLLVAANGALGQLPLSILPTQKSTLAEAGAMPYAEYGDVPWLVRQMAVTQLPSVNALVVLRRLPAGSAARAPFIGFGDPLFGKTQLAAIGSQRKLRNLSIARTEEAQQAEPNASGPVTRSQGGSSGAGKTPAWVDYSWIPPLPDTREEIVSLAGLLQADQAKDVFLGTAASKANVKKVDLSKRKVVAFATHGLLPNDFPGVSEPSLALANPNDGNHGLLTLEEILGLKLDADWVVLSACNTAAGDGSGADAISGLGRGFFYAGTRALLVTHWPVETVSARLLVTGIFERQVKDVSLSRAQALRQSMLALMAQNAGDFSYAHPLFWAPYALVGDGGI